MCNPPHREGEPSSKGSLTHTPLHPPPARTGSGYFACGANETRGGGRPGRSCSSFYNQMMPLLPSFCTCADSTACSQNWPGASRGCFLGDVSAWRNAASQPGTQGCGVRRSTAKPRYRVAGLPTSAGVLARSGWGTLGSAGSGQGKVENPPWSEQSGPVPLAPERFGKK